MNQRGFTLIEILVVLAILGAVTVFATLGFQRLEDDRLEKQAGQLSAWLQAVSDDAVLDGAIYGVWLDARGHRLGYYFASRWWPLRDQDVKPPVPGEGASILLKVGGDWLAPPERDVLSSRPHLVFLPTGMVVPDTLELRQQDRAARLERDRDGLFVWSML